MEKTFQKWTFRESLILITDQLKSCDLDAYSARKNQKTLLNATLLQILNLKQLYLKQE